MTYAAVVASVLALHGHDDVDPLVLGDLIGAARFGSIDDIRGLLDEHGFVVAGHAWALATDIHNAVRRSAT